MGWWSVIVIIPSHTYLLFSIFIQIKLKYPLENWYNITEYLCRQHLVGSIWSRSKFFELMFLNLSSTVFQIIFGPKLTDVIFSFLSLWNSSYSMESLLVNQKFPSTNYSPVAARVSCFLMSNLFQRSRANWFRSICIIFINSHETVSRKFYGFFLFWKGTFFRQFRFRNGSLCIMMS